MPCRSPGGKGDRLGDHGHRAAEDQDDGRRHFRKRRTEPAQPEPADRISDGVAEDQARPRPQPSGQESQPCTQERPDDGRRHRNQNIGGEKPATGDPKDERVVAARVQPSLPWQFPDRDERHNGDGERHGDQEKGSVGCHHGGAGLHAVRHHSDPRGCVDPPCRSRCSPPGGKMALAFSRPAEALA